MIPDHSSPAPRPLLNPAWSSAQPAQSPGPQSKDDRQAETPGTGREPTGRNLAKAGMTSTCEATPRRQPSYLKPAQTRALGARLLAEVHREEAAHGELLHAQVHRPHGGSARRRRSRSGRAQLGDAASLRGESHPRRAGGRVFLGRGSRGPRAVIQPPGRVTRGEGAPWRRGARDSRLPGKRTLPLATVYMALLQTQLSSSPPSPCLPAPPSLASALSPTTSNRSRLSRPA